MIYKLFSNCVGDENVVQKGPAPSLVYWPVRDPSEVLQNDHEDSMEFPAYEDKVPFFSLILNLNNTLLLSGIIVSRPCQPLVQKIWQFGIQDQ